MSYKNDLYQRVILDHNKNPKNFREISGATHSCEGFNPLCGDRLTVYLMVGDSGAIEDVSFIGQGCAISKSSASMMTAHLKGKTVEEANVIFEEFTKMSRGDLNPETDKNHLGKLSIFEGVREYPSRTKCATLSWHTMKSALAEEETITTS